MSTSTPKAEFIARLRRSLKVSGEDETRKATVAARLAAHAPNLVPRRAGGDAAHRRKLFVEQATAVQTSVDKVKSVADVPAAVADYLRSHNLPQALRHGADPLLKNLPWKKGAPSLRLSEGRADPADEVSVAHAFAGVAETGTLILLSGPDNPTTLNFLPETHIVVLEAGDLVGTYEEVWTRLREKFGEGEMPRTVNMITGPSRTADIEQTLELGAHGPRRLHIVIVGK